MKAPRDVHTDFHTPSTPISTRTVLADPPRLTALRLAIQSYGPVTAPGVEKNILIRAEAFARYLNGETDNRV